MNNLFKSKTTIVVIIIVIILVIAYFYYQGGSSSSGSGSLLVSQPTDQSIGAAELNLLDQIQSLKIDPSLFQDPGYRTLQDYSVTIPTDAVGRPNPFAPFPGEALPAPAAGSGSAPGH